MPSPNSFADKVAHRLARTFPLRTTMIAPTRPIVSFSFDDVPASGLSNGARILEAHGARGTFYVAGGLAGREHDGQMISGDEEYRALAQRGHEIAHHTFSHRTPMSLFWSYANDLDRNDAYLAGLGSRNFAFPYGRSSPRAQWLMSKRFRSGRGIEEGINRGAANLDMLRSVELRSHHVATERARFIDDAVATPGWLIYFTHDVQDSPTAYGVTPEALERIVAHAVASGAEVLTVDAALDRLGVA